MQTWEEIKKKFPDEHVAIGDPRFPLTDLSQLSGGDVIDHDSSLDSLLKRCNFSNFEKFAILYTGDLGAAIGDRGMVRVIEND